MSKKPISQYSVEIDNRGYYDIRNKLNNLTGKEWLGSTTTIWEAYSRKYGTLEKADFCKLVNLFSKEGQNLLVDGFDIDTFKDIERETSNEKFDYAIINCFINNNDIEKYVDILESRLKKVLQIISKLNEKKYITILVNEFQKNGNTINSTYYFTKILENSGMRFKGKVNLLYQTGDVFRYGNDILVENKNVYLLHFRKISSKEPTFQPISYFKSLLVQEEKEIVNQTHSNTVSNIFNSIVKMDAIGKSHPAPFSPEDIYNLLEIFTKKGDIVLDPFVGVGSSLIAASKGQRLGIGIDLNPEYIEAAKKRFLQYDLDLNSKMILLTGDSLERVKDIGPFDYCVTSPPYHNILRNRGQGVRHDGTQARQGVKYYSESENDLGNQMDFESYMDLLIRVMKDVYTNLQKKGYVSIVISDFTVNKIEINVCGILIEEMVKLGYLYIGSFVLNQHQKSIYPFGYPYDYVINHTNQYVVNFRKLWK